MARLSPDLHLDFGYGQLEGAIACRSLAQMNCILQKEEHRAQGGAEVCADNLIISPAELAIGWPTGLQRLLDVGLDADDVFDHFVRMDDVSSTEKILAADQFPSNGNVWHSVFEHLNDSSPKMVQVVVQTFARRRQALAQLAIRELTEEEVENLGLMNEKPLDAAASAAYQELQKRRVDIPQNLISTVLHGWSKRLSIYHALLHLQPYLPTSRTLQSFFTNGFELVDLLDPRGRTPLLQACESFQRGAEIDDMASIVGWFLDKGANAEFSCISPYPNVLFYLANSYRRKINDDSKQLFKNFESLVRLSASLCNPLSPDDCQCYCSSAGCLPIHKIWRCDNILVGHDSCKLFGSDALLRTLEKWLSLCGMDETQSEKCYEEVVRLEVFDRLGMAHTCCVHRRSVMDESCRKQLQEEDAELREQLDLILQGYKKRYKEHHGGVSNFWKNFMQDLEEILPGLLPEERCEFHCFDRWDKDLNPAYYSKRERELHDSRMAKEKEALAKKNYLGMDFIDVIRHHFADCLDSPSPIPAEDSQTASTCQVKSAPGAS